MSPGASHSTNWTPFRELFLGYLCSSVVEHLPDLLKVSVSIPRTAKEGWGVGLLEADHLGNGAAGQGNAQPAISWKHLLCLDAAGLAQDCLSAPPLPGYATAFFWECHQSLELTVQRRVWAVASGHPSGLLGGGAEIKTAGRKLRGLKKKKSVPRDPKCWGAIFPDFRFLLVPWLLGALEDNSRW